MSEYGAFSASGNSGDSVGHLPTPRVRGRLARIWRRGVSVGCWCGALLALATSCAWLASGLRWEVDLLANLGAQGLVLSTVVLMVTLVCRRWRSVVVCLLACGLHVSSLMIGRAMYWPREVVVVRAKGAAIDPTAVRVLHYNAKGSENAEGVEALIRQTQPDIVGILAPSVSQQNQVIEGDRLSEQFAGKLVRRWQAADDGLNTRLTAAFVLSVWPMHAFDVTAEGANGDYLIAGVVDRPEARGGPFGIIAVHPRSPRTSERWEEGNAVVKATARVAQRLQATGYPVIVLTDLNSTPSGWRSRHLFATAKLRRSKPVFQAAGTYPESLPLRWPNRLGGGYWRAPQGLSPRGSSSRFGETPSVSLGWPLTLAIDDVLVSPGIETVAFSILPEGSSEHRPVLVELKIGAADLGALGTSLPPVKADGVEQRTREHGSNSRE